MLSGYETRTKKDREFDSLLVKQAKAGDRKAFELLVLKYQLRLFRLTYRIMRNASLAEEIVQETFLKAYRSLETYGAHCGFYTWLYRILIGITRLSCFEESRGASSLDRPCGTTNTSDVTDGAKDINTPESVLLGKQIGRLLDEAITCLPMEMRMAIMLREIEGFDYQEVSSMMMCPIATTRTRIFRARQILSEKLAPILRE